MRRLHLHTYVGHDLIYRIPVQNEPLQSEQVHLNLRLVLPPAIGESTASNNAGARTERDVRRTCSSGDAAIPWIFMVIRRSTIGGFARGVLTGEL